jgi:hypothetical protein
MSALGHSRRFDDVRAMSGLPPTATEMRTSLEVRFVPKGEVASRTCCLQTGHGGMIFEVKLGEK